jgi:hypothetical protein
MKYAALGSYCVPQGPPRHPRSEYFWPGVGRVWGYKVSNGVSNAGDLLRTGVDDDGRTEDER